MTRSTSSTARLQVSSEDEVYALPTDGRRGFVIRDTRAPRRRLSRDRKAWKPGKIISVANLYLSDIGKTILGRYGGPCDTDDGESYYAVAVRLLVMRHIAMNEDGRNPKPLNSQAWAMKNTPGLILDRPRAWFEAQERAIAEGLGAAMPTVPAADDIAKDLGITYGEVIAFKLRSTGAIDRLAPARKADDRSSRAKREKERRAQGGVTPRTESLAQIKPWVELGMSRATYYRKVYSGELPKHPGMRRIRLARSA